MTPEWCRMLAELLVGWDAAGDTSWALLSSLGSSHSLNTHLWASALLCREQRLVDLQKFLSYISLCCNKSEWFLMYTLVQQRKGESDSLPYWHPCCYYKDFSSRAGWSFSFRLSQPCLSHSTFSVQQVPIQINKCRNKGAYGWGSLYKKLACPPQI